MVDLEIAGGLINPVWPGNALGTPGGAVKCCGGGRYVEYPAQPAATVIQSQMKDGWMDDKRCANCHKWLNS